MRKKAQGISINVIIIAAIALLVLVILSVIFIGRVGIFSSEVGECANKGGKCAEVCGSADYGTENYPTEIGWSCPDVDDQEQKCCLKITA